MTVISIALAAYLIGVLATATVGLIEFITSYGINKNDARQGLRILTVAPLWPLVLTAAIRDTLHNDEHDEETHL